MGKALFLRRCVALAYTGGMDVFQLLAAVGMPLAMLLGGYAAWRRARRGGEPETTSEPWRDDSLADWRAERDAAAREERDVRHTAEAAGLGSSAGSEAETTSKPHQRIGG